MPENATSTTAPDRPPADTADPRPEVEPQLPSVRRRRRTVGAVAIGLTVLLVVGATVRVVDQAVTARDHLLTAAGLVPQLEHQLTSGRIDAARDTLAELQTDARAAHQATDGWAWSAGARLPVIGSDLAAVRVVARVVDDVSQQTLPPLVDLAGTVTPNTLLPTGGHVDLAPLRSAAPRLLAADTAAGHAVERIAAIDRGRLTAQVAQAVSELDSGLRRLRSVTSTLSRAAALLPPMLGNGLARTYLVLFLNLAEVRASGGMPGAFAVIRAEGGTVRLEGQGTAGVALGSFPQPVLPLDSGLLALYTDQLGVFPADINVTPDFPTTARLAREMYRRRTGTTVDGVVATDPVALSYLLRATGPVPMWQGPPLSATNAVKTLLSDVYARYPAAADQDRYFASAARTIFDTLSRGRADPRTVVAALTQAAHERRLLVWSAHPDEQAALADTVLGGSMPTDDGAQPTIGVFLNDGSGAKLGYYLTHEVAVGTGGCQPDGRRELTLRVVLGSTAPRHGLSPSVLGLGLGGNPYTMRTNLMIFAPTGGAVVDMHQDGAPVDFGSGLDQDRIVAVRTVYLAPGQRVVVTATMLAAPPPTAATAGGHDATPRLWVTPGVNPWPTSIEAAAICTVLR